MVDCQLTLASKALHKRRRRADEPASGLTFWTWLISSCLRFMLRVSLRGGASGVPGPADDAPPPAPSPPIPLIPPLLGVPDPRPAARPSSSAFASSTIRSSVIHSSRRRLTVSHDIPSKRRSGEPRIPRTVASVSPARWTQRTVNVVDVVLKLVRGRVQPALHHLCRLCIIIHRRTAHASQSRQGAPTVRPSTAVSAVELLRPASTTQRAVFNAIVPSQRHRVPLTLALAFSLIHPYSYGRPLAPSLL